MSRRILKQRYKDNRFTYFFRRAVLDDFRAQIATLDGAQILLVALPIAGVLVDHIGIAGFRLRDNDGVPQRLRRDSLLVAAFLLVSAKGTGCKKTINGLTSFSPEKHSYLVYSCSNSSPQTSAKPGHS